jgi:GMP synthase-like glutamine amidotransferase
MIVFVDNELESAYEKPWGEKIMAARTCIKYRLEDLSNDTCLIIRYNKVNPTLLQAINAKAMFISGNSANPDEYDQAQQKGLKEALLSKLWPVFGFCGGHQVLAQTFGSSLDQIGPLDDNEVESEATFAPGLKKELGYKPIQINTKHPVLDKLDDNPVFRHAHSWELKDLPKGFTNYASTEISPYQLIIHDSLPLMGTQFHPEYYTEQHPAGRTLIENFLK